MDETEYDLSSQSIMNLEHLATRASRKQEIDFKVYSTVVFFSLYVCDGEATFSCVAVETNDQQHSAFCSTYSSWKVYKTLQLSSFVSVHLFLFSPHS